MKHLEYQLQKEVCRYISLRYPEVLFLSDTIGNVKLTMLQAARNKAIQKYGFACPDLLILQPNKQYKGLFIELKKDSPFKKDGTLYKNEHLQEQQKAIDKLNSLGYKALFAWDIVSICKLIDSYLKDV
jgi:hypothetical protein